MNKKYISRVNATTASLCKCIIQFTQIVFVHNIVLKTKQFTHCVLIDVLQRATVTNDKRLTCHFNCVIQPLQIARQIYNTQQLSVGRAVLT